MNVALRGGVFIAAACIAFCLSATAAQAQQNIELPRRIEIRAKPIANFEARDATRKIFGGLEFRGGLELSSASKDFGGLSAIRVEPDGAHFVALSDKGRWFRGRIVYRDGAPAAIADAETAPILGPDGRPLAARGWYDTESIAADGGTLYVGIERVERIVRFEYRRDGLRARGQPIAVPPDFKTLTYNKSLECLAMPPQGMPLAGTLIAITERSLDEQGNHRSFLLKGAQAAHFSVKRSGNFDISDCAIAPHSDLLILERRASWTGGVAMRIRRVPLAELKPDAVVDGPVLIEADLAYNIDNMEGISVHRGGGGEIVLTLVSDDNFSPLQRTVLLQFVLLDR